MNYANPTGAVWRKSSRSNGQTECVEVAWRKSSRSNGQTNCVEVSNTPGAVRDSKNPTGPALSFALAPMLAAIKAGHLVLQS